MYAVALIASYNQHPRAWKNKVPGFDDTCHEQEEVEEEGSALVSIFLLASSAVESE